MKLTRIRYAIAVALLAIVFTSPVSAQVTPNRLYGMLTNTITFTNMAVSNIFDLCAPIALTPGKQTTVQLQFAPVDGTLCTTNQGVTFCFSDDGTNYAMNVQSLATLLFTPLGTSAVYARTNFSPSTTGAAMYMKAAYWTNNFNATTCVSRLTNILVILEN